MGAPSLRTIPATPDLVLFLAVRFSPDQQDVLRQVGEEVMLRAIEADVQSSALTWCAVDDGGPVFMLGAVEHLDGSGAHLWYMTTPAVEHYARACVRLWHRAIAETLARFGAVTVDVPPHVPTARRMSRSGFTVAAPAPDLGGTIVCRCVRACVLPFTPAAMGA